MTTTDPAPSGCPVVGREFDPFDGMPFDFYHQARESRPVFYSEELDAYVVTRHEDCDRILRARADVVSAGAALEPNLPPVPDALQLLGQAGFVPGPGEGVVDEDGEMHRVHRTAVQPAFRQSVLTGLEPFVRRNVVERIDAIIGQGQADIVDAVLWEVPALTILAMMGVPEDEMGVVKQFRGPWGVFGWGLPTDEEQVEAAAGMGAFWQWAGALVAKRMAEPGDDLVSLSIANMAAHDPEIDVNWMTRWVLNAVMAGHETTTNTAAGGLLALLTHREGWEAICADPAKIPNAIEEILRYATGVPTWRQRAASDVAVGDVTIPGGAKIYVALCSAGRDEAVFGPDAETFDVERDNARRHLAFGTGAHTCVGLHMARMEMRVMYEELTARIPTMALVPDQTPTFSRNTSQRGPEHVWVTWDTTAG